MTEREFKSNQEMVKYIGVNCRPDVYASAPLTALQNEPIWKAQIILHRREIEHIEKSPPHELHFVKIDIASIRVVLSDASLANAPGIKTQLGYVILMAIDDHSENILHYVPSRWHRVRRSVREAEVRALIHVVDFAMLVSEALNELLQQTIGIEAFSIAGLCSML